MSKAIDKAIAINFLKLRQRAGFTQQDIADILECTRVNVVRMEKGLNGFTATTIFKLCCIFDCNPNDLFPPIPKTRKTAIQTQKIILKSEIKKLNI